MKELINALQIYFEEDNNTFEFNCSMFLAGPHNATKRQLLIEYLTGNKPPKSKATLFACTQALQIKFTQTQLF